LERAPEPVKGFVHEVVNVFPRLPRAFPRQLSTGGEIVGPRFHDSRHTLATLLLKQNVHPKVVQESLGHASINITLDTYSHVLPGLQAAAARSFDEGFREAQAVWEGIPSTA
jgi:integrase